MQTLLSFILSYLKPFRVIFLTNKTFLTASLLLIGALLCRGGRTICSVLRVLGLKGESSFAKYHHVLNRSRLDILTGGRVLNVKRESDSFRKTSKHPGELKWQVASPQGSTIAGLKRLEELALRGGIMNTFLAAYDRANKLSREES